MTSPRLQEEETQVARRYLDLARNLSRRRAKAAPRLCRDVRHRAPSGSAMKGVRAGAPPRAT